MHRSIVLVSIHRSIADYGQLCVSLSLCLFLSLSLSMPMFISVTVSMFIFVSINTDTYGLSSVVGAVGETTEFWLTDVIDIFEFDLVLSMILLSYDSAVPSPI